MLFFKESKNWHYFFRFQKILKNVVILFRNNVLQNFKKVSVNFYKAFFFIFQCFSKLKICRRFMKRKGILEKEQQNTKKHEIEKIM